VAGTTKTIDIPTAVAPGDYLVGFVRSSVSTAVASVPAGWTKHSGSFNNNTWFYRLVDGTEGATINLSMSESTQVASEVLPVQGAQVGEGNTQGLMASSRANNSSTNLQAPALQEFSWRDLPALLLVMGITTGTPAPFANYSMNLIAPSFGSSNLFWSDRLQRINGDLPGLATTVTTWASVRFCFFTHRPAGRVPRQELEWDEEADQW
jgi:hypothetical protein